MRLPAFCSCVRKLWSSLISFSISRVGASDTRLNNAASSSADVLTSPLSAWPRATSDDCLLSIARSAVFISMIAPQHGLVAPESTRCKIYHAASRGLLPVKHSERKTHGKLLLSLTCRSRLVVAD